jgi:hypothetical protein
VGVRKDTQGWTDAQIVTSLILLNLSGGESVNDLRILESDEGLCKIMRRIEMNGLTRRKRREIERRWRKEKHRSIPSPSAVFRYLSAFHDENQEKNRQPGKAFIPVPNQYLRGLVEVNKDLLSFAQTRNRQTIATLDMDATLVETNKADALYSYKNYKAYQPLNIWWAEQRMIAHTEFRDGNVPAGYEQKRVLEDALLSLPEGVEKVHVRTDTAGYEWELLKYCAEGKNKRFGVIEFAVGADVTPEFKKAVFSVEENAWKPIGNKLGNSGQEWAEVCFVPNKIGNTKNGPDYRFIAIREPLERQLSLPGMGMDIQQELPFPTMRFKTDGEYKIFGLVTNRNIPGEELIKWHRERCGKSEEAHSVMKEDLAGGKLPSGDFGENAAWWWIMILSLNINAAMKELAMGGSWVTKRMKAIRFALINIPGRVMERSRKMIIRISKGHPNFDTLVAIRQKIAMLVPVPSG